MSSCLHEWLPPKARRQGRTKGYEKNMHGTKHETVEPQMRSNRLVCTYRVVATEGQTPREAKRGYAMIMYDTKQEEKKQEKTNVKRGTFVYLGLPSCLYKLLPTKARRQGRQKGCTRRSCTAHRRKKSNLKWGRIFFHVFFDIFHYFYHIKLPASGPVRSGPVRSSPVWSGYLAIRLSGRPAII